MRCAAENGGNVARQPAAANEPAEASPEEGAPRKTGHRTLYSVQSMLNQLQSSESAECSMRGAFKVRNSDYAYVMSAIREKAKSSDTGAVALKLGSKRGLLSSVVWISAEGPADELTPFFEAFQTIGAQLL